MPIIRTEQNPISGQEYLDAGSTRELVGQLKGYAEGYNEGYEAGVAAGGGGNVNSVTFYAWTNNEDSPMFTLSEAPAVGDNVYTAGSNSVSLNAIGLVAAVGEGTITVSVGGSNTEVTRISTDDKVFTK